MNFTLPPLDVEQQAALDQLRDEHNATTKTQLTSEQYIASVIMGILDDRKRRNIERKGEQIIAAAKSLPDDKRLAFTAAVEQAYAAASA